ncbi:MAG: ribosome small subunit-dependent GTPase [Bacteroidota bacterium]|jgi:ribosome biogenesis GTPase
MNGLVIKNTGSWYLVRTDDNKNVDCRIKGSFRLKDIKSTNPITVGDRVTILMNADNTGVITTIAERKNYIIRRSSNLSKQAHIIAANLDLCFLIVTVTKPITTTIFIDRFLSSAEAYRIPVNLLFNKIDVYDEDEKEYMQALINLYEHIGYSCYQISAQEQIGLDILNDKLKDKITLFSGHSGVGKSTLINSLVPHSHLKTGSISDYHGKGMHTTTFSEMLELPQGGFIIDTPGIKGFGTVDMTPEEIGHYFPELFKFSQNCRFNNCIHLNEPGCAVVEAVEKHWISESRYKSYLNILEDESNGKYRK